MSISTLAMIVYFLAVGIGFFFPFPLSGAVAAVAAIVAGVALIVKK